MINATIHPMPPPTTECVIQKIVSGGQTGVDRAALDIALELGIPCGGWCPKGRRAEDGPLPDRYPLKETDSVDYKQRTRQNVEDSDGTLILNRGDLSGGTAHTVHLAESLHKPFRIVDLDNPAPATEVLDWASRYDVRVLNVAGPRESKSGEVYDLAVEFLRQLLAPQPAS